MIDVMMCVRLCLVNDLGTKNGFEEVSWWTAYLRGYVCMSGLLPSSLFHFSFTWGWVDEKFIPYHIRIQPR